ncbi:NACHT domain-containing protein [Parasphingopyxis lamellibrachiae]|uniref:NACHT domain-containing protein n=1 Tax=Parasphingopyxis lamellibrachiae TaxID=680125 RepID=A0A3D9FI77_9SPHN|nr:NACHT domain-containing protein [Parasphingopyxis lamellibrachiae]RED17490.1 NACHT domain-containing protein [Parasphingopyxis lamellibrachiae]
MSAGKKLQKGDDPSGPKQIGGSAAGGGFSFQAAVCAIAAIHLLRETRLGWLHDLVDDTPIAISVETGGPGDDLQFTLRNHEIVEVQVKRGLRRGRHLWEPLISLATGIRDGTISYGILAISPDSSRTIKHNLARDLRRLGDGREDGLSEIAKDLVTRLRSSGLPTENTCAKLRIVTVSAIPEDNQSIAAATGSLGELLSRPYEAANAWNALASDSMSLIEHRGRRTIETAVRCIERAGINVKKNVRTDSLAALVSALRDWTYETSANFGVIGLENQLPIDTAWLEQSASVLEHPFSSAPSLSDALASYHDVHSLMREASSRAIHAGTVGWFFKQCVVVAGPGMGKSILLQRLARNFSRNGFPVLQVRLRSLVERMHNTGCGFSEGLFDLALDKSGIPASESRSASIGEWVILCDGLDECGKYRSAVQKDLADFAIAHPEYRVIVTSRPIGYVPGPLESWRHYALNPLSEDDCRKHVSAIISSVLPHDPALNDKIESISSALKASAAWKTIAPSPLLLGLAIASANKRGSVKNSIPEIYREMFLLIQEAASAKAKAEGLSSAILDRTINLLGFRITTRLTDSADAVQSSVSRSLENAIGCAPLDAKDRCERAVEYWRDVGLVERIHHDDVAYFTFVHKTFAEFAAARQIADHSDRNTVAEDMREAAQCEADLVLQFAASLGMAEDALDAVLKQTPSQESVESIERVLAIAGQSNPPLGDRYLEPTITRAFQLLGSLDRETLESLGESLSELCEMYPSLLMSSAGIALEDDHDGVALVGWVCALKSDSPLCKTDRLADAMKRFRQEKDGNRDKKSTKDSNHAVLSFTLPDTTYWSLLVSFGLAAASRLAGSCDPKFEEALIALLRQPAFDQFGVASKLEQILKKADRADLYRSMHEYWFKDSRGRDYAPNIDDFGEVNEKAELRLLAGISGTEVSDSNSELDTSRPLVNLSAFIELTGWGRVQPKDLWQWQSEEWVAAEQHVLWATLQLINADRSSIANEAAALLSAYEESRGHYSSAIFNRTVHVDAPAIDWSGATEIELDLSLLEQALYQGSVYLVQLAASLIDAVVTTEQRRSIVDRLYESASGASLWAGASLCSDLPNDEAVETTLIRLNGEIKAGCEHLFGIFQVCPLEPSALLFDVLEHTMLANNPQLAAAAARVAAELPKNEEMIGALLREAQQLWLEIESQPSDWPRPVSPCEDIAKAMLVHVSLSNSELLSFFTDSNSNVRANAATLAAKRWRDEPAFRDFVFENLGAGEGTSATLSELFELPVKLTKPQAIQALKLMQDADLKIRKLVIPLLKTDAISMEQANPALDELMKDELPEIRKLADEMKIARQ